MIGEMKYFMRDMQVHELNLADSKDAKEQEKNSKTIESFVMIAVDGGEVTFICLDGQMPRDETEKLIIEATKN